MKEVSQRAISTLIAAADDSSEEVRGNVVQAFRQLGGRDTDGVLTHAVQWMLGGGKPNGSSTQRFWVFRCISEVIKAHASTPGKLSATLIRDILTAARADMVATTDLSNELAKEAGALYVLVWELAPAEGMKLLLFQDGGSTEKAAVGAAAIPHFFVLKGLTDCCNAAPLRAVPFVRDALQLLVPMLASIKQDNPRMCFSSALAALGETVLHLERHKTAVALRALKPAASQSARAGGEEGEEEAEPEQEEEAGDDDDEAGVDVLTPRSAPSLSFSRANFSESFSSACQHLLQEWSRVSEFRVRGPVIHAIGAMSGALDGDTRASMFPKVVNAVVAAVKKEKPKDLLLPAQAGAAMCDSAQDNVVPVILSHAEPMLQCIAQCLTAVASDKEYDSEGPSGPLHTNQRHLLRWAENIALCGVSAVVSFASKSFDPKTGSKEGPYRSAVVNILRHICSRRVLASRLEPHRDHIIATLKLVTTDPDWRVRRAVAAAVTAMATNSAVSFMSQVGAKDLLSFIVRGASLSEATVNEVGSKQGRDSQSNPAEDLRDSCRASLSVMCTSQNHLDEAILWPGILEHMAQYEKEPDLINCFLPTIVRCIPPLADRMFQTESFYVDFKISVNMPKPGALVAILCAHAISAFPLKGVVPNAARTPASLSSVKNVLAAMESLAALLDEPFTYTGTEQPPPSPIAEGVWYASIPEMRELIAPSEEPEEGAPPPALISFSDWEDVIVRLVTRTVTARPEADWLESIANAAIGLMPAAAIPGREELFRGLCAVAGAALGRSERRDLVAASMDTVLDIADPDRAGHRNGAARMLSCIAVKKEHVDLVLEKLSVVCRPPPEKKGGFFSFGKDKETVGTRKISDRSRAMGALALCQVARKLSPPDTAKKVNPTDLLASRFDASIAPLLQQALSDAPDSEVRTLVLEALLQLDQPLRKLSGVPTYIFKARDGLLDVVLTIAANAADATNGAPSAKPGDKSKDGSAAPNREAVLLATLNAALNVATLLIACVNEPRATPAISDRLATLIVKHIIPCRAVLPALEADTSNPATQVIPALLALQAAVMKSLSPTKIDVDAAVAPLLTHTTVQDEGSRLRACCVTMGIVKTCVSFAEAAMREQDDEAASSGAEPPQHLQSVTITAGTLLAQFIPRLFDPTVEGRKFGADLLTALMKLHGVAMPVMDAAVAGSAEEPIELASLCAEAIAELKTIRTRLFAVDLSPLGNRLLVDKEVASLSKTICSVIVRVLPTPKLFMPLLDTVLNVSLKDPFADGVGAACVTLHGCIRGMGGMLSEQMAQTYLIRVVAAAATVMDRESTLSTLLVSVRNLAKHHGDASFNALVKKHEPPHAPHVIKAIQAVAGDGSLNQAFVNYCVDTILNSPLLRDDTAPQGSRLGVLNPGPVSAASALGWCGGVSKCEPVLAEMRATLLCVLALYTASIHELPAGKGGEGARISGEAAHLLVRCVSCDVTTDRLERHGWMNFVAPGPPFISIVCETIKFWAQEDMYGEDITTDGDRELPPPPPGDEFIVGLPLPPSCPTATIVEVAEFILPYAEKPVVAHRRVAIGIIGAVLLRHSHVSEEGDTGLLLSSVTALLGRTGPDEDPNLRFVALRSFGQLLCHEYTSVLPYISPACTALLSNFDDPTRDISLSAMDIFARFLRQLSDKTHIQAMVVNASLKMKVKYEHPDPLMRAAAFGLLAAVLELAVDGLIDGAHPEQQANTHLVCLLAHSQEEVAEPRNNAKLALAAALRLIALRAKNAAVREQVAEIVEKPHMDPSGRASTSAAMEELLSDVAALWVTHFPGRVNDLITAIVSFFEAPQQPLRLAATALAGAVLKQLPPEELPRTNAEIVLSGLMRLSKSGSERSEEVRARAVKALGGLPVL